MKNIEKVKISEKNNEKSGQKRNKFVSEKN